MSATYGCRGQDEILPLQKRESEKTNMEVAGGRELRTI